MGKTSLPLPARARLVDGAIGGMSKVLASGGFFRDCLHTCIPTALELLTA